MNMEIINNKTHLGENQCFPTTPWMASSLPDNVVEM